MKALILIILLIIPRLIFGNFGWELFSVRDDTCGYFGSPHVEPGNSFCANEDFQSLAALATSGGILHWYTNETLNNLVATGSYCTPLNIVGTTTYYVVAIEGECISEVSDVDVTIFPVPDVQISPISPLVISLGESVVLNSNFESGNLWYPDSTGDTLLVSHAGEYILQVTDENLCIGTDTAIVSWIEPISNAFSDAVVYIPNSFTPNGDGINDIFEVSTNELQKYHIQIFNCWGERVFEAIDPDEPWTGGGNYYYPDGVYVYLLNYKFGGKWIERNGRITLYR